MSGERKLRVGVVGAGSMGQNHGQRLLRHDDVSVVAVCDEQFEAAARWKQKTGAQTAAVFTDFDRMLAECPLDALHVCLPPFAHSGQEEKAAAKGIHLFLEKPIALTVARAEAIVKAIEKSGVVSQVGYHLRFCRGVERLRRKLADGSAGRPTLFEGRYWCNILPPKGWWQQADRSGGQVVEQVIHIYDMAVHLLGEPASVTGAVENLCHREVEGYTIEDTSVGLIRFRSGALASITGSNCALPMHFMGSWRVVCERAVLDYRTTGQSWVTPDESTLYAHDGETVTEEKFREDADAYGAETDDFLHAIRTGGKTRSPARDGLNSLRMAHAVLESARRGGEKVDL